MNDQVKIQAYTEVLAVVNKYPEEFKDDYNVQSIKDTLGLLKMQERFGVPLNKWNGVV